MAKPTYLSKKSMFAISDLPPEVWGKIFLFAYSLSQAQKFRKINKFFDQAIVDVSTPEIKHELQDKYHTGISAAEIELKDKDTLRSLWLEERRNVRLAYYISPFIDYIPDAKQRYQVNIKGIAAFEKLLLNLQNFNGYLMSKLKNKSFEVPSSWINSYQKTLLETKIIIDRIMMTIKPEQAIREYIKPQKNILSRCLVFFGSLKTNPNENNIRNLFIKLLVLNGQIKGLNNAFMQQNIAAPLYLDAYWHGLNNVCTHLDFLLSDKKLQDLAEYEDPACKNTLAIKA